MSGIQECIGLPSLPTFVRTYTARSPLRHGSRYWGLPTSTSLFGKGRFQHEISSKAKCVGGVHSMLPLVILLEVWRNMSGVHLATHALPSGTLEAVHTPCMIVTPIKVLQQPLLHM